MCFAFHRFLAAIVILGCSLSFLSNVAAAQIPEGELVKGPPIIHSKPLAIAPGEDPLQKLLKERYNEALMEVKLRYPTYLNSNKTNMDTILGAVHSLKQAGLDVFDRPADRIAFCEQLAQLAKYIQALVHAKLTAQEMADHPDRHAANQLVLEMEIQLLKAKKK
jgi:hypothetical protein